MQSMKACNPPGSREKKGIQDRGLEQRHSPACPLLQEDSVSDRNQECEPEGPRFPLHCSALRCGDHPPALSPRKHLQWSLQNPWLLLEIVMSLAGAGLQLFFEFGKGCNL